MLGSQARRFSPLIRIWATRLFATFLFAGLLAACSSDKESETLDIDGEWPMYSMGLDRTGYNSLETVITKDTVSSLVVKWKFPTKATVAASPVVATIDIPDEGSVRAVIAGSYDGNVYAVRAEDGAELWHFAVKPHAGISYGLIASTASIAVVEDEQRVFIGGGETMYALDAGTGQQLWAFDAGTGCTDCDIRTERNEILSSPAVLPGEDLVLFGMDVNDNDPGKGGFYALSAKDGTLRWYFDVQTGATCTPDEGDDVRKFDGFHDAADLGLAEDFFTTRDGCDFDRTDTACGSVWSPVSVDQARELIYFTTSNCDTDDDPATAEPPPPMSIYNEALVVLHYDGFPAWTWRPREVDNDDLAFGAAPNLFTTTIEDAEREVVGLAGKDGTYYLLDRDGENELTGDVEPYWQRNVVPGGSIGGIQGTPAVVGNRIIFATGIGLAITDVQRPTGWALDAATGEVVWSSDETVPFFGSTSAVPGVWFGGGIDFNMHAYDSDTGDMLFHYPLGGVVSSQAVVVDGVLYIGSGFGAASAGGSNTADIAAQLAKAPAAIWAFCVAGEENCQNVAPTGTP